MPVPQYSASWKSKHHILISKSCCSSGSLSLFHPQKQHIYINTKTQICLNQSAKNQILGSHSLEKVQKTCKSRVTLKQHKYYTTKLGRQNYLLDMELRCPILKFPQKNSTKHDVFFLFLVGTSRGLLTLLDVLALFQTSPGFALANFWSAPTKTYTKTPHPPEIPEKKPYEKKTLNPNYPIHILDLMFQAAKRDFFVHFVSDVLILLVNFHLQKPRVVFVDRSWMIDLCTEFWWRYMYWVKHRHRDSKTTTNFRCYKIFHLKLMLKERTRNMSVETSIAL